MNDWLNDTSEDNGYLGLDDPAMPDTAPAPPTASDSGVGGWLDDSAGQPAPPPNGFAPSASDNSWLDDAPSQGSADMGSGFDIPTTSSPAAISAPTHMTSAPVASSASTLTASFSDDLQVMAPQLEYVQPNPRSVGGTRGDLSTLVLDVEVQVEVGLGNASLTVEEFLEMGQGSIVELDTPIDAPIELKVRGKLIARGQLVSINGAYGMRIIEMMNQDK